MVSLYTDERMLDEERKAERFDDVPEESALGASEQQFRDAALRVIIQRNDFLLPNLIDMLRTHKTLEVSPYYQRRARWDTARKSRLIESFLVNIPVPPVFLYENEFARYEVMDGQQRVSAILEYFENQFELRGLEILNSLIGKRFHQLPSEIRAGLERRSLPAIILLKESTPSYESTVQLRRYVFERLNTGGVRLNAQEVRNCIYAGSFNDLLLELSRHPLFTTMWDLPPMEPKEDVEPSARLRRNILFRQMRDVELVLRALSLLNPDNISFGMTRTLDNAMATYSNASESTIDELRARFTHALELAYVIGGDDVFRVPEGRSKRGRLSASLFDGIMVALMRNLDYAEQIRDCADQIRFAIRAEFGNEDFHELVVGRANTREATLARARYIEGLITQSLEG